MNEKENVETMLGYLSHYEPHKNWHYDRRLEFETAYRIPNHRQKAYVWANAAQFEVVKPKLWTMLGLAMTSVNDGDTTFELMYHAYNGTEGKYIGEWSPVPLETMENLFKGDDGKWCFCAGVGGQKAWEKNTTVEVVDGHLLLKYDTNWLRGFCNGIRQDGIYYMLPGKMVAENLDDIGIAVMFRQLSLKKSDVAQIRAAACDIISNAWSIDNYMTTQVEYQRGKLNAARQTLEKLENERQQLMEEAADAMNILSTKYGVEVAL